MRRKAIICDIDNCLLNVSKIEKSAENLSDGELFEFFEDRANDLQWVMKSAPLFHLIQFYYSADYEIILLTARSKRIQAETYKFLTSGVPKLPKEIMIVSRGLDEEGIPDEVLKESKLVKLLDDFDVEISIDDKAKNCEMYNRFGIFTLQVVL